MTTTIAPVRILVIRPWTQPLNPLRTALRQAGIQARIIRVDFEPALNAALVRGDFDVILFDESTRGLPRSVVEARLHEHHRTTPIVTFGPLDEMLEAIRQVAHRLLN